MVEFSYATNLTRYNSCMQIFELNESIFHRELSWMTDPICSFVGTRCIVVCNSDKHPVYVVNRFLKSLNLAIIEDWLIIFLVNHEIRYDPAVNWHLIISQFNTVIEQNFLQWKQQLTDLRMAWLTWDLVQGGFLNSVVWSKISPCVNYPSPLLVIVSIWVVILKPV